MRDHVGGVGVVVKFVAYVGFPQFLKANAGIVPQLDHDCFLPNPFQFISHPIIQCRIVQLLTAPLNYPPPEDQAISCIKAMIT
jgi:hypothetical protein